MESSGDLWQGLVFSLTLTRHMATERKRAYAQALAAVRQGMLMSDKEHSLPAFGRGLTACPSLWALLSTTTLYGAQRLGRVLGYSLTLARAERKKTWAKAKPSEEEDDKMGL